MSNPLARGGVVALVLFATWSAYDLRTRETDTIVLYTTPALRDVLERFLIPAFEEEHHVDVLAVYVTAGEQLTRLRMSGNSPEAALFLHASPLFIEKGYDLGQFLPYRVNGTANSTLLQSREVSGGHLWYAFTWSPLVEVYAPRLGQRPDLATLDLDFGFPHPRLSNNGVYTVAFFENVSKPAGERALAHTSVQPVNARANIQGVSDGTFDVTLGYEAVVEFWKDQGANVAYGFPVVSGKEWTLPVVFCAGLVHGADRPEVMQFLDFLFANSTQERLQEFHLRPIPASETGDRLPGLGEEVEVVRIDWSEWRSLEAALSRYEVGA